MTEREEEMGEGDENKEILVRFLFFKLQFSFVFFHQQYYVVYYVDNIGAISSLSVMVFVNEIKTAEG